VSDKSLEWAHKVEEKARLEVQAMRFELARTLARLPRKEAYALRVVLERTFIRGAVCGKVEARGVCGLA